MLTAPLGDTGVDVSAMCLGTMYFGWRTDRDMSFRLLDMYRDAGGTFLDTANIYGKIGDERTGALSEKLLGEWMRERGNRDDLFIATKVGFHYVEMERGLTAKQIETECEKSLQRMGIDTIDLYYAHVDDRVTPLEETGEAFERLVQAGKVRYIGASNFRAWRLEAARRVSAANGWSQYCCVQQRHSYLRPVPGADFGNQVAANVDLLDYCRSEPVTLLAYSPLLSGAYVRDDRPIRDQYLGPDTDQRMAALKAVAQETGATPNQVVLAWMLQSDPQVLPVFAASNTDQLKENLGALDLTLTADQLARMG